jgi:asparagine synthase (glutamine-hydrolysing)
MCGITGFGGIGVQVEPQWIRTMTHTLKHRGPDDEGYLAMTISPPGVFHLTGTDSKVPGQSLETFKQPVHFFLGHRRLSILDPTPAGHQPMSNKNENIWLIYNGEIYNYLELRETLRALDYQFRTNTDTEVLLAAYERWGENCLDRLDGMWAFVIYDKQKNLLFGARDRFGVKPLYYYHDRGYFAFASEIKSLVTLPFIEKNINPAAVFDFLAFSGLDFVEESFFKNIFELQPAHAFTYDLARGNLQKKKYFTLTCQEKWEPFNEEKSRAHIQRVRDLVCEAVRLRLRSDVPVGSALSGGIDSSAIVCVIGRLMAQQSQLPVGDRQKVFTAGFPGKPIDESPWAKQAAEHANAQWFMTVPTPGEFRQDIENIAYYQDTPYGSPSVYAQYRVMRLAKENGVKVVLDGQGADELFTGYSHYYPVFYGQMLKHLNIKSFSREMKHIKNAPLTGKTLIFDLVKQARRSMISYPLLRKYRMKPKPHHLLLEKDFWEKYQERVDLIDVRDFNSLNPMLLEYFTRQKLAHLLKYEDRNSMRFSIESRTPFADYLNLIEYVFNVPAVYKIHNGYSKFLLRESMQGILPENIRLRTDKKGFFIPGIEWLTQLKNHWPAYLHQDLEEFVNISLVKRQLTQGIDNVGYEDIQMLWRIIILAVWQRVFFASGGQGGSFRENRPPGPPAKAFD